jgi:hypothetical protein
MGRLDDDRAAGSEKITRRIALRRFGKAGLVAMAGAGVMEFIGAGGASAKTRSPGRGIMVKSGVPVATGRASSTPQSPNVECRGTLAVGHCGGPCPSGYWCYNVNYCCFDYQYICLHCSGTPSCYYFC